MQQHRRKSRQSKDMCHAALIYCQIHQLQNDQNFDIGIFEELKKET